MVCPRPYRERAGQGERRLHFLQLGETSGANEFIAKVGEVFFTSAEGAGIEILTDGNCIAVQRNAQIVPFADLKRFTKIHRNDDSAQIVDFPNAKRFFHPEPSLPAFFNVFNFTNEWNFCQDASYLFFLSFFHFLVEMYILI